MNEVTNDDPDARGNNLFEASVILNYLEDKFSGVGGGYSGGGGFLLETPEARAAVEKLVRVHDLYIASANCTQWAGAAAILHTFHTFHTSLDFFTLFLRYMHVFFCVFF